MKKVYKSYIEFSILNSINFYPARLGIIRLEDSDIILANWIYTSSRTSRSKIGGETIYLELNFDNEYYNNLILDFGKGITFILEPIKVVKVYMYSNDKMNEALQDLAAINLRDIS